jgi:hypothetical protein
MTTRRIVFYALGVALAALALHVLPFTWTLALMVVYGILGACVLRGWITPQVVAYAALVAMVAGLWYISTHTSQVQAALKNVVYFAVDSFTWLYNKLHSL